MHSSCSLSCWRTWQVVSGPAEGMQKWGSGSSPGREVEGRGRTGVEWKLAPHYLQQLVHSLMIKCRSSICDESVCLCVWERENICVHINICSLCLFNSPLHHFKNKPFLYFRGENNVDQCCSVCLKIMILRGVCCSGRGSCLTQGKARWRRAELCYPLCP